MAKRRNGRRAVRNTEGRRRLTQYLLKTSQSAIARALHLEQPTISAWARGAARPEPQYRQALDRITEGFIPFEAWYSADELLIVRGTKLTDGRG